METKNELAQLLKAHKRSLRIGDKRLADLANDYAGIPLVNRSSVRNWSDGTAKVVRDWRPLVAIAAALRLDDYDTNALLKAGECPDLAHLATEHPDEQQLFRYWEMPEATTSHTQDATNTDLSGPGPDPQTSEDGSDGPTSDEELEPRAVDPQHSQPDNAEPGSASGSDRSSSLLKIGGAVAVFAVLVGGYLVFSGGGRNAGSSVGADASSAPITEILAPAQGSVVGESFIASGKAAHPTGVSHVEAVLVDQKNNTYWNPDDEIWQQRWRVFAIPVSGDDRTDVSWQVKLGDPVPLLPGDYRFRVWTRSMTNLGDPIGPLVEFTVTENLETGDEVAFARAEQLQNNPVMDPAFALEDDGVVPKPRSRYPPNGSSVLDGFLVRSEAEYDPGLASMSIELRSSETGDYWDFDADRWQTTPIQLEVTATEGACGACQALEYETWMPGGAVQPGDYVLTTSAIGTDGAKHPSGHTAEFTVIGP